MDEEGQDASVATPALPDPVRKFLVPEETNFTPGETSDVSWITTDILDHDKEVIVAAGIDYASVFMKNRAVFVFHKMQTWPVGTCEWLKLSKGGDGGRKFNGLIAKTIYDEDPDAQRVFGMVKRGVARGKSITVLPPKDLKPGEWGPPTKAELAARPDWAGAKRVIRRSVLVEYSVVGVPSNQHSLVLAISKGLEVPSFLEDEVAAICKAAKDEAEPEPETPAPPTFKANDYVEWGKGMGAGVGRVASIHKAGKVPGCSNDCEASEAEPAARVRVYHKGEDAKYKATDAHMGHKCSDLSKVAHPLDEEPASKGLKGEGEADTPPAEDEPALPPLPPHRTIADVEASLVAAVRSRFDPEQLASSGATSALDRARGVV